MTDIERAAQAVKETIDAITSAALAGDVKAARFAGTSQLRRDSAAFTHELLLLINAAQDRVSA